MPTGRRTPVDPRSRRGGETARDPVPARVARRGRSESTSGRSTPTGSARPSTASTPPRSRPAWSPRPAPIVPPRSRPRSAHSRARSTAGRRRASCRCSTALQQPIRPTRTSKDLLDRGDRLMGFGHRVYRAEDPRSRLLRGTAMDLGSPRFEVAEKLERSALAELQIRKPDRVLATNVEFWSAVVLDVADIPPKLAPAMFACSRTAGWSAHILEQKRLGRLVRPSARYVGPGPRSLLGRLRWISRRPRRSPTDTAAEAGSSASSRRYAASGTTRSRRLRATPTTGCVPSRTARSRSFGSARSSSCCAAGSRTRAQPFAARP